MGVTIARNPEEKRARAGRRASRGIGVSALASGLVPVRRNVTRIEEDRSRLLTQARHVAGQSLLGLAGSQLPHELGLLLLEGFPLDHVLALELQHGEAVE